MELDEHGPALPRAGYRCREQAPSAVRNGGFHGPAGDAGHEHPRAETLPGFYLDPRPVAVLNGLRVPERTGGFERNERRTGDVPFRRTRPDDPERVNGGALAGTSAAAAPSSRSFRSACDAIQSVTTFWNAGSFMNRMKISSF